MSFIPPVFKGKEGLESYYRNIYQGQWDNLYDALQQKKSPVNYVDVKGIGMLQSPNDNDIGSYSIDQASYLAVLHIYALIKEYYPQEHALHILDMCAAPGGKSLALLHLCMQNQFSIDMILNEKSKSRFHRLMHNVQNFFLNTCDNEVLQSCNIRFENRDGNLFGKYQKNTFDLVIVDAPCSNTQHVLHNKKELAVWNSKHNKRLAIQQTGLLCAAIDSCKNNGVVCYMTCSIDPQENHGVIEKVMTKRAVSPIKIDMCNLGSTLQTVGTIDLVSVSYGTLIIPSMNNNIGPLYLCVLAG